jgi:type I restriction enzyme S subunit
MIADLQPYAEYKDSGLPWLGQVPGHWEIQRLKNWVTINRHTLGEDTPTDFAFDYLDIGAVTTGRLARRPKRLCFADAPSRARRVLQSGDTIVSTVRTYLKAVLTVNECAQPIVASTGFAVLSPRADTTPRCLGYVAQSEAFTNQVTAESVGIAYPAISETRLGNIAVTLPPPEEQAAIVRFLDWANGRLERAIRAKRKVIALLNEQKQAIIHRAVTRGLDPSIPLKPSGIPWLGDIPQHWEVRRLKSLCRFVTSGSRGWARYYADAGFVFLRIGNISTTSVDLRMKRITYVTPPEGAEGERTRAIPDDLLLSITAQIGAVGVVPKGLGEAFVNQHTALIRLRQGTSLPRWVAYGLLSSFGKDQCRLMTNGGTKVGLTLGDVRCLVVLLPPTEEQEAIVAGIERQTGELESAIIRLEREIDLLREYRTRLVADVVTGKLDVREAAAQLPDEAPLDATDDEATLGDEIADPTQEEAGVE